MIQLILSIAALFVGPALHRITKRRSIAREVMEAVVIIGVGVLVMLHILPHCFEVVGWSAIGVMLLGLLGPTVCERGMGKLDLDAHAAVIAIVILGVAVHAVLDGAALALPSGTLEDTNPEHAKHAEALSMAVVLHRVLVGLIVWRLLSHAPRRALLTLGLLGSCTLIGYLLGGYVMGELSSHPVSLFEALVAGSLLHVVVHNRDGYNDHGKQCESGR